jgi:hypothetical protein
LHCVLKQYKLFLLLNVTKGVVMAAFKHLWMLVLSARRRLSDALYMPSQTGSHQMGDQYMGDYASSYVENHNFPDSARAPFKGLQIHRSSPLHVK